MSESFTVTALRASSAELLCALPDSPDPASLGTAFLVHVRDPAHTARHFAVTAHHCIAESHALGLASKLELKFPDRVIAVKDVVGVDSYLIGNDIAILELAQDPELPDLPWAAYDRDHLLQASFLVRGCASGMRTQYSNLWGKIAGIELLRERLGEQVPRSVELLELSAEVFSHNLLRGISGAPICYFPQGESTGPLIVVGITREVCDRNLPTGRFYGTPILSVGELSRKAGLELIKPPIESRRSAPPISSAVADFPIGRTVYVESVRRYAKSLMERWKHKTSPLLPADVALPSIAVDLSMREPGLDGSGYTAGYQRDVYPLSLRQKFKLRQLIGEQSTIRRMHILGDPGSGKTTLLQMEAARIAADAIEHGDKLPILLSLAEFEADVQRDPRWSLKHYVESYAGKLGIADLWSPISESVEQGRIILLLDGADEVSDANRDEIVERLLGVIGASEGNAAVITSRKVGFRRMGDFPVFEIAPLRIEQQRELLLQICGAAQCAELLRNISGSAELRDLASVPLTLSVLGLLARELQNGDGFAWEKRSQLLGTASELLLEGRHRNGKGVKSPELAQTILARLSFDVHAAVQANAAREVYPSRRLEASIEAVSANELACGRWTGPKDFILDVSRNTGLLVPVDSLRRSYSYLHRGFREYFCAHMLSLMHEDAVDDFVQQHVEDPQWSEVFTLFAGLTDRPTHHLAALANGPVGLAFRALAEVERIDPDVALAILQVGEYEDLRERRAIFRRLETMFDSVKVLTLLSSYLDSAREKMPRADLYFIQLIAEQSSTAEGHSLAARLFEHLPKPPHDLFSGQDFSKPEMDYWCDVPAGPFVLGAAEDDPLKPPWVPCSVESQLPHFRIGRMLVTNRMYRLFDANHGYPQSFLESTSPQALEDHPVVNVSWYEANLFCQWASQTGMCVRLPTEIEWEKAASWDDLHKVKYRYPWGDDWHADRLNSWQEGPNMTTPVGLYLSGAAPCGAMDMAGNVWEWCNNWFIEGDELTELVRSGGDFPNFEDSGVHRRVDRGGGWYHDVGNPATFLRAADDPADRFAHCGFRLVMDQSLSLPGAASASIPTHQAS
ncbi:SUMF1/EgtB/PvdO family nonheme iron enzyme [Paraburkholderia sp. MM5482-R1]|uniref:SUMF1/EgtB/PvdO family nonheme iron enzyme n=1 Tax=unclassified Paraburkholderia TaxID=2615204 RepID=UPI003D1B9175